MALKGAEIGCNQVGTVWGSVSQSVEVIWPSLEKFGSLKLHVGSTIAADSTIV